MRLLPHALLSALAMVASTDVSAQASPEPLRAEGAFTSETMKEPAPRGRERFFDPEDGAFDLSSFLENPRGFLPIPIVVTEPAVGYGGGAAGMFLRPRKEAGEEGWSRPDISAIGAFATENGTKGAFAGDASRWMDGRLRTLFGAATGQVNLDFYGLGPGLPSLDQKVRYSLQFAGAVAQVNWQLAPKSPWAIGMRYVFADVDPKLREEPQPAGLADSARIKISAPTAILEYDTRDNIFTPTRGIYAETSWLASREALGSTDDFERFQQIVMGWQPLARGVTLGVRGSYAWSSDGTPFFLRPFVQLRGVPAMRYQGDQVASLEVEGRWRFFGRWSGVLFGGGGTTRTTGENFSATQNVGSGGFGFRYELARKFGLDVGIDVARSPGTTAVYLVVGNSWFRP
ncbi:hypothetical protein [Variovorax ginsengisoli]|uniref:Bacterial surface antigen (D15) domain-containing protein n=1 Tax=Variovorax ginsengisoli TaxID=363844 RepID=A0ABT8SGN6_9BURK|nr:hypothetical protein [Variovorax ginsengisoli]MDN8618795.1 hypothetical protein [Variovorax ginsengisoli]MDO1537965.1 hypothetical protein [Variovorax ginsengisoli]